MTKKSVISFWGVPVFAGPLGSLPIGETAAKLSVYAPAGVISAVQGGATKCNQAPKQAHFRRWYPTGLQINAKTTPRT
jgi:hypothetical protein